MTLNRKWQCVSLLVALLGFQHQVQSAPVGPRCDGICGSPICGATTAWEISEASLQKSVALVYGTVVQAVSVSEGDCIADVTVRVKKRWAGTEGPLFTVRTGASCARPFPFAIGHNYLIYAVPSLQSEWPPTIELCGFAPLDDKAAPPVIYKLEQLVKSRREAAGPSASP